MGTILMVPVTTCSKTVNSLQTHQIPIPKGWIGIWVATGQTDIPITGLG